MSRRGRPPPCPLPPGIVLEDAGKILNRDAIVRTAPRVPAGTYTLTMTCDGGGKAFFAVSLDGNQLAEAGAACNGSRETARIKVPAAGEVKLSTSSVDAPLLYAYHLAARPSSTRRSPVLRPICPAPLKACPTRTFGLWRWTPTALISRYANCVGEHDAATTHPGCRRGAFSCGDVSGLSCPVARTNTAPTTGTMSRPPLPPRPPGRALPQDPHSNEPVSGEELDDWADDVLPDDEGHVLHKSFGSVNAGETHADSTTQLPVGTYSLTLACRSRGRVSFTVRDAKESLVDLSLRCGTSRVSVVQLSAPTVLSIQVGGRAGGQFRLPGEPDLTAAPGGSGGAAVGAPQGVRAGGAPGAIERQVRQLGLEQFSNLLVGAEQRTHSPIVLASSLNSRCMRLSNT